MKYLLRDFYLLITLSSLQVMAQEDISGEWRGNIDLGEDVFLRVQFSIQKQADGSWSAVLDSLDRVELKNIRADSTKFDGSNLQINIAELRGTYNGVFKDGTFEGEWEQGGSAFDLNLAPYTKPVLSQADINLLLGEWQAKGQFQGREVILIFRFELDNENQLVGFTHPANAVTEMPVTEVELSEGTLSFRVPAVNDIFIGEKNNDRFVGTLRNTFGRQIDVTLTKEKYELPKTNIIDITSETLAQLIGEWYGEIEMPNRVLPIVFQFENNEAGEFVALMILNPPQNTRPVSVVEIKQVDGKLSILPPGPGRGFLGELSGDEIKGDISVPFETVPLTLKKRKER